MTKKILVVGQTPPPFHGQAMMIERTLKGKYGPHIKLIHIRMNFSKEMDEIGKLSFSKVIILFKIVCKILYQRLSGVQILYYFPAGPNLIPIIRDIVILGLTRIMFKKIIFHYRAAGISEYYKRSNKLLKLVMKLVYHGADVGIQLSEYCPPDAKVFSSKRIEVIYNGIEDNWLILDYVTALRNNEKKAQLLYIGVINKTKGVLEIVQAMDFLRRESIDFQMHIVGKFEDRIIKKQILEYLQKKKLEDYVVFHGVKIGKAKFDLIFECDIFLFPSYFESEGLPGSVIEAMNFGKPVIATNWRGIPSLIVDGKNGYLVPIKDSIALSERIKYLILHPLLVCQFGKYSRELYEKKFTLNNYYSNMDRMFREI